ncbi:MAG: DUF4440 domain-containing protein [Gemmatimonadaceae bacterium]
MASSIQGSKARRRHGNRIAATVGLAGILVFVSALSLLAHDFWMVPNAFIFTPGETHEILGQTGTKFPASGAAGIEARGEVALAASDSSDVVAVVMGYHAALASGDSTAALALLALDAIIVETGGIETREQYRSGHLRGDIGFASGIKSERGPVRVVVHGDVAWATSTSSTQGEYRGRPINSASAELMVLSRMPNGWKIRAIHWSSRARRQ